MQTCIYSTHLPWLSCPLLSARSCSVHRRAQLLSKDLSPDIRAALQVNESQREALTAYKQELETKLKDGQEALDRAQEQLVKGRLSEGAYDRLAGRLQTEQAGLREQLGAVEQQLGGLPSVDSLALVQREIAHFRKALQRKTLPPALKQQLFQAFVSGVTVRVKKGEKLHGLQQQGIAVQLMAASAGTDLTGILPKLPRDSTIRPEPVRVELGLNLGALSVVVPRQKHPY